MPVFTDVEAEGIGVANASPWILGDFTSTAQQVILRHFPGDTAALNALDCDELLADAQTHREAAEGAANLGLVGLMAQQETAMNEAYVKYCQKCQAHQSYDAVCVGGGGPLLG